MHWCRQLFVHQIHQKCWGFSDGPDLAQTPSFQHAVGVTEEGPALHAGALGMDKGLGAHFWDGMGWGPQYTSWDGMESPSAHFPKMDEMGGSVHTVTLGWGWGAQ